MRHIELALAERCGLTQLPEAIKEACTKVECPPLSDVPPNKALQTGAPSTRRD
jgi:hypothetical protein